MPPPFLGQKEGGVTKQPLSQLLGWPFGAERAWTQSSGFSSWWRWWTGWSEALQGLHKQHFVWGTGQTVFLIVQRTGENRSSAKQRGKRPYVSWLWAETVAAPLLAAQKRLNGSVTLSWEHYCHAGIRRRSSKSQNLCVFLSLWFNPYPLFPLPQEKQEPHQTNAKEPTKPLPKRSSRCTPL